MPTAAAFTYGGNQVVPLMRPDQAGCSNVTLAAGTYAAGTIIGEKTGNNEVQRITITGSPTGGTFTVTFNAVTSAAIAYNASAATVQAALEAMSSIGADNVQCSGGALPGTAVTVTFVGALANTNVAQMTTTDSLTGGSTPASAVTTITAGSAGTAGTFAAYDDTNSDGSQLATHILRYGCVVDGSGNVSFGDASTGEWTQTQKGAPAWRNGIFRASDLVGFEQALIDAKRAVISRGSLSDPTKCEISWLGF